MQKHVNLVDLVKSFPTNIYLQNLASIQKRTSPVRFAHLAEKSGKGSISNLSTKAEAGTTQSDGIRFSLTRATCAFLSSVASQASGTTPSRYLSLGYSGPGDASTGIQSTHTLEVQFWAVPKPVLQVKANLAA